MKLLPYYAMLLFVLLQACQPVVPPSDVPNDFSSAADTLHIKTERIKGSGLFGLGYGSIQFQDTSEKFSYPVRYPAGLVDLGRVQIRVDYQKEKGSFVDIISGKKNGKVVFAVDQNANHDFRDDSLQVFLPKLGYSSENAILCQYQVFDGQEYVSDSGWVKIVKRDDRILFGRDEHISASFFIDKKVYQVGVIDHFFSSTFNYGINPEIALLSHDGVAKDSLLQRDMILKKEYLKLDEQYYEFDSISPYGDYITLIREDDFHKLVGTQVGMLAPPFTAITTNGDTIRSAQLKDRPTLIGNSCGCGGDQLSTEAYYNIRDTYGEAIHALRLDTEIKSDYTGWHIDTEAAFNKDLYEIYRKQYCSRMAYLVGGDQRIKDKFWITDWKTFLPNHLPSPISLDNN